MNKLQRLFDWGRSPVVKALSRPSVKAPMADEPMRLSPRDAKALSTLLQVYTSEKPSFRDFTVEESVNYGLKVSAWVYACIWRIMKAASSVPWYVQRQNATGDWRTVRSHPIVKLMARPNPMMSYNDLSERITCHLYLAGNAFLQKIRDPQGNVVQLWPVNPDRVEPIVDADQFILGYRLKPKGSWTGMSSKALPDIPARDMIHFQFTDPSTPYWGLGPLQAGMRAVQTDIEALVWQKNSLSRRAVKDGALLFKEELSQEQYDDIIAMIREQMIGADNARGPLVIGADATYVPYTMTPAELDYVASRKMTREEICSVFGVPPPLVGIFEQAALANIKTAREILWMDTVIPYLEDLAATLTLSLLPDFEGPTTNYRISYDLSGVEALRQNFADKLNMGKVCWSMGIPFKEINRRFNLGFEPFDGWEVGWLASTIRPTSAIQKEAEASAAAAEAAMAAGSSDSSVPSIDELPAIGDQLVSGTSDSPDPNNPIKELEFGVRRVTDILREAGLPWN